MPLESPDIAVIPKPPKKILSYGAFGVSVVVHLFLLMMVGGVVLIEQTIPRTPFKGAFPEVETEPAVSNELDANPTEEPMPTDMPMTETKEASGAIGQGAVVPEVISTDNSLSFSAMSAAPSSAVSNLSGTGNGSAGAGRGETVGGGSRPATRVTIFGPAEKAPESLEAVFYDTKQSRNGKPTVGGPKYSDVILDFVVSGFRDEKLSKYFQSGALYPTRVAIPFTSSAAAITAFDVVGKATPTDWIVHYHGKIVAPKTATYRFAGAGDDFLYVAVDGKLVLDACHELLKGTPSALPKGKYPNTEVNGFAYGKWIDLVAGQSYDFDVAIGDYGASFGVMLFVQEKGIAYAKDPDGRPILPLFRTDKKEVDRIGKSPVAANGPIFAP